MKKIFVLLLAFLAGTGAFKLCRHFIDRETDSSGPSAFGLYSSPHFGTLSRPNFKRTGFETNGEGFRDTEDFNEKLRRICRYRIVILGSSGAFGLHLPVKQTLAPRFEAALASQGILTSVFNLSTATQSSFYGINFAEKWLPLIRPDLLITSYGYMEFHRKSYPENIAKRLGIGPSEKSLDAAFIESMAVIADLARPYGPVLAIPPVISKSTPLQEKLNGTSEMFDRVAAGKILNLRGSDFQKRDNFHFLDHLKSLTDPALYLPDGRHFSEEGTRILVEKLIPEIGKWLRKNPPRACDL